MKIALNRDFYAVTREWPYKNVKRRIIAEKLLEGNENGLDDYKIHCFSGNPKFILVCKDRFNKLGLKEDFYDLEWKRLKVKRPGQSVSEKPEAKPKELEKMLEIAERLSKDFPFLRVDFYCAENKIHFGELTLHPASGAVPFEPDKYDNIFGSWLNLNQ